MEEQRERQLQTRLLFLAGALAVLTVVAVVLQLVEPSHDPAEIDGDPDGKMFETAGFAIWCILALLGYGVIALLIGRMVNHLPLFVPEWALPLTDSRAFLPGLAGGIVFGAEGAMVGGGFALVWVVALAGIVTEKTRRIGGTALFVGVAVGTLIGVYLRLLHALATP